MTKSERIILLEIYNVSDSVPNFRNNTDMAAHASFRMDALELQGYIKKLTFSILMSGTPAEDKNYWINDFEKWLYQSKEFIAIRKKEQWTQTKDYTYQFATFG